MPRKIDDLYYELKLKVDKFDNDFKKINGKLDRFGNDSEKAANKANRAFGNLRNTLIGLASVAAITQLSKSFINAADTAEQYRVRLEVLLGSVEQGNRVFSDASQFASGVAFEYREVLGAATQLATVLNGGSEEIKKFMPLLADIAASTGLTLQQTAEQFTRAMSAGIGAADLFRERGVTAVLGFEAGAKVSIEETRAAFENALNDMTFKFRGASDRLGGTWSGLTSMLSDKWFQFRNEVLANGVFDLLKGEADALNQTLGSNLKQNARATADAFLELAEAVELTVAVFQDLAGIATDNEIGRGIGRQFDNMKKKIDEILLPLRVLFGTLKEEIKDTDSALSENFSNVESVLTKYDELAEKVKKYREEQDAAVDITNDASESSSRLSGEVVELSDEFDELSKAGERAIERIHDSFTDFIADVIRGRGSIKDFGNTILDALANKQAAELTTLLFGGEKSGSGGFSGTGIISQLGSSLLGDSLLGGLGLGGITGTATSFIGGGLTALAPSVFGTVGAPTAAAAAAGAGTAVGATGAALASFALPAIGLLAAPLIGGLFGGSRPHPASTFAGSFNAGGGIDIQSTMAKHLDASAAREFASGIQGSIGGVFGSLGINPDGTTIHGGVDDGRGLLMGSTGKRGFFDPENEADISRAIGDFVAEAIRFDPALAEQAHELRNMLNEAAEAGENLNDVLEDFAAERAEEIQALADEALVVQTDLANVTTALDDALANAVQMAETFERLTNKLTASLSDLFLGANSALSPEEQLAFARQQAEQVAAQARVGNVDALDRLPDVLDAFLTESREFNASNDAFKADFAFASSALQDAISLSQRQAGNFRAEASRIEAARAEALQTEQNPFEGQSSSQLIAAMNQLTKENSRLTTQIQDLVAGQDQARRVA